MREILESVLDRKLDDEEIESIKLGWNEFYKNPEKYRNTIVVDMVRLSLE